MATPPQLTPEQRSAALAKAAEARAARAEIKARLKMGSMSLSEALASDDPNVGKLKVVSLLESLPDCEGYLIDKELHRYQTKGFFS